MKTSLAAWFASFACLLILASAEGVMAQPIPVLATFASGSGNDANDCLTPATACRSITAAVNKLDGNVNAIGTVHVLPGSYTGFNLTRSVNVIASPPGQASVDYAIATSHGAAAGINIGGGEVVHLSGFALGSNLRSLVVYGSGAVHVENCTCTMPVEYRPTGASELYLSDSVVGGRLWIQPTGSGSAKVVVDNVNMTSGGGIFVDGNSTSGAISMVLRNSEVVGAGNFGLYLRDNGGAGTVAMIEGTTLAHSVNQGVAAFGSVARLRNSNVIGNKFGIQGNVISHGGNVVIANTSNGSFTSSVPQQ